MRARSCPDPSVHSASQAWAVSSASRLATGIATSSASDASRTKARTSSPRAGSSTNCSSEECATEGEVTMQEVQFSREGWCDGPFYDRVLNET